MIIQKETQHATLFAKAGQHAAPAWIGLALGWIIALIGQAPRAYDYLTGPDPAPANPGGPVRILSVVEQYGSTRVWGWWILAAACTLVAALLIRRIAVMLFGHLFSMMVYGWYGIALAQGVAQAHDGLRFVTPVVSALALNVVCVILLSRELFMLWVEDTRPRRRIGDRLRAVSG